MRRFIVLLALFVAAGCDRGTGPVEGPYTGAAKRFRVDALLLPEAPRQWGDDFTGGGNRENQLGALSVLLGSYNLANRDTNALIASGAINMSVELLSNDDKLGNDDSVGVRWYGTPKAPGDQIGARLHDGTLVSNELQAAYAEVMLPLFDNADPVPVALDHWDLTLTADGGGGFDGIVRGTTSSAALIAAGYPGLLRALEANLQSYAALDSLDADHDGLVTEDEVASNTWVKAAVQDDVPLAGGRGMSIAFRVHLVAGDADGYVPPAPPRCDDRVENGDEVAVDCGGSCGRCWPGDACAADGDCGSGHCDAGVCRAPACDDGVRDGWETDVDCGYRCGPCADGKHCSANEDCASGKCEGLVCYAS